MATDFWASSHYKRWIVDRSTLKQARSEDLLYVEDPEYLDFLAIFFANIISKLGKKLGLRQRVIATATVFFRRFYLKNSYCETDPFIVIAACCYLAAKAEESPVHIKTVLTDARAIFSQEQYTIKSFPSDNAKLAEIEFYLVSDLECDLTVFHPYRTLVALCTKDPDAAALPEAGELGPGLVLAEGKLLLKEDGALQMAWFIINDTYRSELCLLYPPHVIAVAAIYLTLVLHEKTRATLTIGPAPAPRAPSHGRRSSRHTPAKAAPQDPIDFLAGLNVSMPLVATAAQEILALYALWDRYQEDALPSGAPAQHKRKRELLAAEPPESSEVVTPGVLMRVLARMREARANASGATPRAGPVNRLLEKAQAAG